MNRSSRKRNTKGFSTHEKAVSLIQIQIKTIIFNLLFSIRWVKVKMFNNTPLVREDANRQALLLGIYMHWCPPQEGIWAVLNFKCFGPLLVFIPQIFSHLGTNMYGQGYLVQHSFYSKSL